MERLLKKLNEADARYVVIGGQAMLQEEMPRFTLDWDVFVPPFDKENFAKINTALLGAAMVKSYMNHIPGAVFIKIHRTTVATVM